MGSRAWPSLAQCRFRLMPELLDPGKAQDPERASLQALYARCYQTIFETQPRDRIDRRPESSAQVLDDACQETGCSLRMFMLSAMLAHRETMPQLTFYANMLMGPAAKKRAMLYRGACAKLFGTFDLTALNNLTQRAPTAGVDARLLNSEILAGEWIVGYKLRFSGSYGAPFYAARELSLDPYWLAIEPSYLNLVLVPTRDTRTDMPELDLHRFNVCQTIHALKRNKAQARDLFNRRAEAAPEALRRVLGHFGFKVDDFHTHSLEVTDMLKCWGQLALAIKTALVARLVDGDTSVLALLRAS